MIRHIVANVLTLMIVGLIGLAVVIASGKRSFYAQGRWQSRFASGWRKVHLCARYQPGWPNRARLPQSRFFALARNIPNGQGALRFGSYLIPDGASMDTILDLLTRGGASTCGSEIQYRIGVTRIDTLVRELDPATQRFEVIAQFGSDEDAPEEYAAFTAQADIQYRITVAEGATSWQIWEGLRLAEFLSGEPGDVPREGWLAPDSYAVQRGADRQSHCWPKWKRGRNAFLQPLGKTAPKGCPMPTRKRR
jgi:UPF0755 protein